MALATGSLLADRYEITAAIATGGMGEVWQARDRVLDRVVAAKVLRSEYTGDPSFLARFRNEARHTAALSHPNIASVYDYGETMDETGRQKLAFLVMEFVEGRPLHAILHDEGRLPVDWTLHVLGQSAEGLSAAHRGGVVHRDIKPGNLLVRPDGVVKLTDFGIAQARDATPLTKTGMVVGTAQYLSPEQAQGMEVTAASDVYSLGVVAYECLAGSRPFDGASQVAIALAHINRPPPPLPADVPPAVRLLVERALAKDPADRFLDGGVFAEAIHRVAAGGSLTGSGLVTGGFAAGAAASPPTAPTRTVDPSDGHTQLLPATGPGAATGPAAAGPGTAGRPMPPLHAGDDDEPGDAGAPAGGRRRDRRLLWVGLSLLLVLLLAGGAFLLSGGSGDPGRVGTQTPAGITTTAGTAVPFAFDPTAYIGENFREVEAELDAAGLEVTPRPADAEQLAAAGRPLEADDVAATDPSQPTTLQPGDEVVLYYAQAPFAPGGGGEPEPAPTASTAPETTSTAPETTSTAPTPTTTAPPPSTPEETSEPATTTTAAGEPATSPTVSNSGPPVTEGASQPEGDGG